MEITLYQVPFSRIQEIEELKEPQYAILGIAPREKRLWFYYDLIPYGVGALDFRPNGTTVSIGPIWVSEDFRNRGVSTKYTGALAHYALRCLKKKTKILEMSPIIGPVTNRHLRNEWEYLGVRPGDGRYAQVRKVFQESTPNQYIRMFPNFTFTPAEYVFRQDEKEDIETVRVYQWTEEARFVLQQQPQQEWTEPEGMVHSSYILLDTFTYSSTIENGEVQ